MIHDLHDEECSYNLKNYLWEFISINVNFDINLLILSDFSDINCDIKQ